MRPVMIAISYALLLAYICTAEAQTPAADANEAIAAQPTTPSAQQIALGEPNITGTLTVDEAIAQQKRITNFSPQPLENRQLGQLAWAAQSAIDAVSRQPAPENIAATMNLYFCFPTGVYRYTTASNTLDISSPVDARAVLAAAAHNETALKGAPCIIIVAGSSTTTGTVTREQARNMIMLAAGKIVRNIEFEAQSLGLATCGVGSFDIAKVKRLAKLQTQQEPAYIIAVGYPAGTTPQQAAKVLQKRAMLIMSGSSPPDNIFNVKDALIAAGISTTIAQSGKGRIRIEQSDRLIEPDMQIENVVVDDYDVFVIISGTTGPSFVRERRLLDIIRMAVRDGKIVAASGDTTAALANAGILNGVRVTGNQRLLIRSGGIYTGNLVESDQGIVTAQTDQQPSLFARAIITALKGRTVEAPPTLDITQPGTQRPVRRTY